MSRIGKLEMKKTMRYITGNYKYVMLAVGCLLLTACSSSSEQTETRTSSPLQVTAYITNYHGNDKMRAVADGYSAYTPDHDVAIGLFPIQIYPSEDVPDAAKLIRYSNGLWHTQVVVEENSRYIIYGYMPMKAPITGAVDYSGQTLTLSSVPAVMADDICFVTGVKDGTAEASGDLSEGVFAYTGKSTDNYVCLLMDHLYVALKFRFSISASYSALRTIRLKSMTLSSNYQNVTATVGLGSVPATVTYTPVTGTTTSSTTFFEDADGKDISNSEDVTAISGYTCCFAPIHSQVLTLVSVYDVYDRYDNLIRQDCTSTNVLPSLETLEAVRGDMVTLNLNVNPTYLYQLSDQDLDNLIEIK